MRRIYETRAWLMGAIALTLVGCGSEETPNTGSTTESDESSDSTSSGESSAEESTSSEPDGGGQVTPPSPPAMLGEPVLEEVPPQTELAELDDDQLAEVCEAYVKTATAVSESLALLCPAQGLFQAVQSTSATDDDSFQAECSVQVTTCESDVAAAQEETPEERCESASSCGASIEDFNACNRQIAALNGTVLTPLSEEEVPACEDTSLDEANNLAVLLGLQLVLGLQQVETQAGGSPTDPEGPCQRINEMCPDLGVALGAFSDLGDALQ